MQTIELNHTKRDNLLLMILWQINQICNRKAPTHPSSKQQLEPDMEQKTGSKLGKEYVKAVYCHPAYLTYMQSTSWDAGLNEAQAGIKIARRNINNLRYADDTTLWQKVKKS